MRTRAFNLCKEHWKLLLLLALVGGVSNWLATAIGSFFGGILGFWPALAGLLQAVAGGVVTILLYPLQVGITYILLNLWQCSPANPGQLLLFYKSPRLCRSTMVMGGIVTVIFTVISMAQTLLTSLFGGMLGFVVQVPLSLFFAFLTIFLTMRFLLVPVLYLADPNCPAEQAPKASYSLMRGHCVDAFFFQLVTMLVTLPIILVLGIVCTLLIGGIAIPALLLGGDLVGNLLGSTATVAITALILGFIGPWVDLCLTGYAIERVLDHPAPPPANRFVED